MTGDTDILERVNALKAAGEAFALATVVRTRLPSPPPKRAQRL